MHAMKSYILPSLPLPVIEKIFQFCICWKQALFEILLYEPLQNRIDAGFQEFYFRHVHPYTFSLRKGRYRIQNKIMLWIIDYAIKIF